MGIAVLSAKIINKNGERICSPEDFGFKNIEPAAIFGGNTMEEASQIFMNILHGKGTHEQNAVVVANAALALQNTDKFGNYEACLELAKESLSDGKALKTLKSLID